MKQQLCNYIYYDIIHKNITFTQNNVLFTVPQQLFVVCQKEEEVELSLGWKWRLHYQMELEQVLTLLKEMYRDQFGEFLCGYWGLKD